MWLMRNNLKFVEHFLNNFINQQLSSKVMQCCNIKSQIEKGNQLSKK